MIDFTNSSTKEYEQYSQDRSETDSKDYLTQILIIWHNYGRRFIYNKPLYNYDLGDHFLCDTNELWFKHYNHIPYKSLHDCDYRQKKTTK